MKRTGARPFRLPGKARGATLPAAASDAQRLLKRARQNVRERGIVSSDMTIKELIEELSKYNEELEVLIEVAGSDDVGVEPRIVLTHRKSGRSCLLLEN